MLTMGFMLMVIDCIITMSIMISLLDTFKTIKPLALRRLLFKSINNPMVAFLLNLIISNILAYFTSDGMVAGMANLASSILVGMVLPWWLRKRYAEYLVDKPKIHVCDTCGAESPKKTSHCSHCS